MNGLKSFTTAEFAVLPKETLILKIKEQQQFVQNTFYYHEEDQLRHCDAYGWSAVEYLEHLNMIFYNLKDNIQAHAHGTRWIWPFLRLADRFHYPAWQKKARTAEFLKTFLPISKSHQVILNPQKVFQDYITVVEELMEALNTIDVSAHYFEDAHFASFASSGAKITFLLNYSEAVIQYIVDLVKNRD